VRRSGGGDIDTGTVASGSIIGRSIGMILNYHMAKWWAKNGVETIAKWIKRKWSKMRRERLCNPEGIPRN